MAETVQCMICGESLKTINQRHLNKHGITLEDYKKRFPDARLHSDEYLKNHSDATRKYMAKPEQRAKASVRAKEQWRKMRERMVKAVREGVKKRGMLKRCVDCGRFFHATNPHEQIRCPDCQKIYKRKQDLERYRRRYGLWYRTLKESTNELTKNSVVPFTYIGFMNDVGTKGTPAMNLAVLPNGRVAGAVWLETGKIPSVKGTMQPNNSPKTPWRRRLKESGWQRRIMERCPNCGEHNILVYQENPHCWECGSEIVFARENENYTVSEHVCSKCGLVDNGQHFIFKCKKCKSEYRVLIGIDGEINYQRVS